MAAAAVLAPCYGLAVYGLTADRGKGAAVALFVAAVLGVLLTLLPRHFRADRSPALYVLPGLLVLVGPFVMLHLGRAQTPWYALQARFPASGPRPPASGPVGEVALLERTSPLTVRPWRFGGVATSIDERGLRFDLPFPMDRVYRPLLVPRPAVTACRDGAFELGHTSLVLADPLLVIAVADFEELVLDWCREHGLAAE